MSVKAMLKRRGFRLLGFNPPNGLVFDKDFPKKNQDRLFELMHHYGFRTFLKDVILYRENFGLEDLTRYCSEPMATEYLKEIFQMKLVQQREAGKYVLNRAQEIFSLGETLEWYLARLMREEWECDALYRVTLKDLSAGGDYDVLAECENQLIYLEVKSSPPKSVELENIRAFLHRVKDLSPHLAIFFEDTTLRMMDKIVPHCEQVLNDEYREPDQGPIQLHRVEAETFRWHNLFITNSKPGIKENIQLCLRTFFRG